LGEIYRQLDVKVSWHGKPERAFFEKALGLFKNSSRDRILVIGDGPETDLLGANELGLDSAFIAGGLFSEELQVVKGKPLSLELLTSFLKGFSVTTTYALPFLK
jgi:ribonucleotide monophosphatase NagD (HAD superfamily)